jgi:hypothetical protein
MANPFAASESDAIEARTLNLTLFSGLAAAIASAIVAFNESFEAIFGDDLTGAELAHTKLVLLVAVIAAFALIAVADMLARAWASSAKGGVIVTPVPGGPSAKTVDGDGFTIAAMRVKPDAPDEVEYLLVKADAEPTWAAGAKVRLVSDT